MIYDIATIVMIVFSGALGWLLSTTYLIPKIKFMTLNQKFITLFLCIMLTFFSLKLYYSVL
jgi:hypothetical protein